MDEITKFKILHQRKNSIVNEYPIGSVVDDMNVIDYVYRPIYGLIPICKCLKCGRIKELKKGLLDARKGTTHSACGQFTKSKMQDSTESGQI